MVTTKQTDKNRSKWSRRLHLVKRRSEIALNSASWQAGVCMGKAQEEGGKKSLVARVAARAYMYIRQAQNQVESRCTVLLCQ